MTSKNKRIAIALVLVGILAAVAGTLAFTQRDDTARVVTIHLGVRMVVGDETASFQEGATCGIANAPEQQVVVANARSDIVGQANPDTGTLREGDDGNWSCAYDEDLEVEESAYYTFTVNGQYSEVIDRQTLEATDWNVTLVWLAE